MTTLSSVAGAVLTLIVASVVALPAQETNPFSAGDAVAPAGLPDECDGGPVAVVGQFLSLSPEQAQAFAQLLQARQEAVGPILQEIARREQRIRELIASNGDPAAIGSLVVQIYVLRQRAETVQGQFVRGFESVLVEEQRQRWQQVRMAARLQPVVPAFQALQML